MGMYYGIRRRVIRKATAEDVAVANLPIDQIPEDQRTHEEDNICEDFEKLTAHRAKQLAQPLVEGTLVEVIEMVSSYWKGDSFCSAHQVSHQRGWDTTADLYSACYCDGYQFSASNYFENSQREYNRRGDVQTWENINIEKINAEYEPTVISSDDAKYLKIDVSNLSMNEDGYYVIPPVKVAPVEENQDLIKVVYRYGFDHEEFENDFDELIDGGKTDHIPVWNNKMECVHCGYKFTNRSNEFSHTFYMG